jgi:hypothetical protein
MTSELQTQWKLHLLTMLLFVTVEFKNTHIYKQPFTSQMQVATTNKMRTATFTKEFYFFTSRIQLVFPYITVTVRKAIST